MDGNIDSTLDSDCAESDAVLCTGDGVCSQRASSETDTCIVESDIGPNNDDNWMSRDSADGTADDICQLVSENVNVESESGSYDYVANSALQSHNAAVDSAMGFVSHPRLDVASTVSMPFTLLGSPSGAIAKISEQNVKLDCPYSSSRRRLHEPDMNSENSSLRDDYRSQEHDTDYVPPIKCGRSSEQSGLPSRQSSSDMQQNEIDVYLNEFMDGPMSLMSMKIDDYKLNERKYLSEGKEMIKMMWINRAIDILGNMGLGPGLNFEKLAADMILKGKKVKLNAKAGELKYFKEIYALYRYWKEIHSYQCLLISAPNMVLDSESDEDGPMTLEENKTQRLQEMKNFCLEAFPAEDFDGNNIDDVCKSCEVFTREDVRGCIKAFFEETGGVRAKRAINAMIVFFGHGSEHGFSLCKDDDMNLDEINLFVKDCWRHAITCEPCELPAKVEVLFAQCFGHNHDKAVECDRFRVISFTTPQLPYTLSSMNESMEYVNEHLQSYSTTRLKPLISEFENERWNRTKERNEYQSESHGVFISDGDEIAEVIGGMDVELEGTDWQ